jgi:predicted outer membrane repeat protein
LRNGNTSFGGGIYCSGASPEIVNNTIIQNQATNEGGGIYCSAASPLIATNLIQGNSSIFGGAGIACANSAPKIRRNRIVANSARGPTSSITGGISLFRGQSVEISDNLLLANTALPSVLSGSAGGISARGVGSSRIINNTIAWCQTAASYGGGIYCDTNSVTIVNNIIAYCSGGVYGVEGMTLNNNCVFGNGQNYQSFTDPTGLNGNISVDPQFATNPFRPDFHIIPTSPCRDAGDSTIGVGDSVDIDGDPRIVGAAVDIGCDEFQGATPVFTPTIIRVSPTGDDANDGSSWISAKRTVQAGIDVTTLNGGQVWVAAGIYNENLTLRHFVSLYGGFVGTETSLLERNWTTNATILDGGQNGRVILAMDLQRWNAVDGFVIRNGRTNVGAGIYCIESATTIAHNVISNNVATPFNPSPNGLGGGIYCEAGTVLGSSQTIISNVFYANRAVVGGGIACAGFVLSALIANNRFEANVAQVVDPRPGFVANGGGGIFLYRSARPIIQGNYFLNNVATNTPGSSPFAMGEGGAVCVDNDPTPRILNNTMIGNLAINSPGIYTENGGGVSSKSTSAKMINNIIAFGSSGISTVKLASDVNFSNLQFNCVFGNATNYLRMPDLTGTNGNISADPLFVTTNDFHLGADSPCIGAGTNNVVSPDWRDLDGQMRIFGASVDIGADEYGSTMPFTLLLRIDAEQSTLKLTSETGRTYVFEASSDFVNWTAFSTNRATDTLLELDGVVSENAACRFFRAWVLPESQW